MLGIRPEHVLLNATGGFTATVEAVEHYGDRMDVVLQTQGHRLVARCSPDASIQEGKSISVAVDLTRAHLFEQNENGMRMA